MDAIEIDWIEITSDPCLFDLDQDPFEMKNLFAAPPSRETARELARALAGCAQHRREPYASQPALRTDLDWAAQGVGAYTPPKREPAAKGKKRSVANEDEE